MNDMTITRKSSAAELDATVKRDADGGPIVTRDGYTVISPADGSRLLQLSDDQIDAREFEIVWRRRNEPAGATSTKCEPNTGSDDGRGRYKLVFRESAQKEFERLSTVEKHDPCPAESKALGKYTR